MFTTNLVFKDEFSGHECLSCLLALLDDGMPQQFGRLIHTRVQLHHWGTDAAAQQLVFPLGGRANDHVGP